MSPYVSVILLLLQREMEVISPSSSIKAGLVTCFKEETLVNLTLYEFWILGPKKPFCFHPLSLETLDTIRLRSSPV